MDVCSGVGRSMVKWGSCVKLEVHEVRVGRHVEGMIVGIIVAIYTNVD